MTSLRRYAAMVAIGGAGAAVMTMQWWCVFVVLPAVVFAFAIDPDQPLEEPG